MLWAKIALGAPVAGVIALLAEAQFNNTITTGSIIIGAIVLFGAGLFTIKSHVASDWRQEAEAQHARADRLQEESNAQTIEQQKMRHDLKEELATARAEILLLQTKTDLSAHEEMATQRNKAIVAALDAIIARLDLGTEAMKQIADRVAEIRHPDQSA